MRLSKQEMFDRAVSGLRSQGFERCVNAHGEGVYADDNGRHCAWGWVDTSVRGDQSTYYVADLATDKIGLAPGLTLEELEFANSLQWCHDTSDLPIVMERRLRRLGEREDLTWPA